MGGMQDLGPVLVEPAEPVFHASWEARVFGIGAIVTLQGLANTNTVRHAIERMDPAHYESYTQPKHLKRRLRTRIALSVDPSNWERAETCGRRPARGVGCVCRSSQVKREDT